MSKRFTLLCFLLSLWIWIIIENFLSKCNAYNLRAFQSFIKSCMTLVTLEFLSDVNSLFQWPAFTITTITMYYVFFHSDTYLFIIITSYYSVRFYYLKSHRLTTRIFLHLLLVFFSKLRFLRARVVKKFSILRSEFSFENSGLLLVEYHLDSYFTVYWESLNCNCRVQWCIQNVV